MEHATLGKTGVRVSGIGFGGAPAGLTNYLSRYSPEGKIQRRQVIEAIEKTVELGISSINGIKALLGTGIYSASKGALPASAGKRREAKGHRQCRAFPGI